MSCSMVRAEMPRQGLKRRIALFLLAMGMMVYAITLL